MKRIDQYWGGWNWLTLLLLPLSLLFCMLVFLRRWCYRLGLLKSTRLPVPVIVVGNISVGGTGKTPLVIWLARWLQQRGMQPGILIRGYGGRAADGPCQVAADTPAWEAGDEAVLLSRRTGCPVYIGRDRRKSGALLLSEQPCDVIIADDGLQHYALRRDVELAVIDGERRFGNGLCLPAGPLREPRSRLESVDLVICNGTPQAGEHAMRVAGTQAVSLDGRQPARSLEAFAGGPVEAIAGIGNPERFFTTLESAGLSITRHRFPDHHPYSEKDLAPFRGKTVLMTEKDAVKCELFSVDGIWYIPADASFDESFTQQLELLFERLIHG